MSKRQLVQAYKKKKKSLKKVPKRGQTPNLIRLVVAVDDERGQKYEFIQHIAIKWWLR